MSTNKVEGEKGAIEKSVEELIRTSVGYARTLFVLGLFPWRAGGLVDGQRAVSAYVTSFLFVSSFFFSAALGVLVEVLWSIGGLENLQGAALKGISGALHPNLGEALISLLPGIVCVHLVASLVARLLANDPANDPRIYRLACLAFSLHAFILAVVLSILLLSINALVGLVLTKALIPALTGRAYHQTFFESMFEGLFTYGPFVLAAFLVLHFPTVAWFGTRAVKSPVARPGRWKVLLVAAIYPFAFAIYAASIVLPHALITSLSPRTGDRVVLRIDLHTDLAQQPGSAVVSVLLSNQTGRAIGVSRERSFALLFDDAPEGSSLLYDGTVVDWSGGSSPWLIVPANGSAWLIVRTSLRGDFCSTPGIFKHSAIEVQVVAKTMALDDADHDWKEYTSQKKYFCTIPSS